MNKRLIWCGLFLWSLGRVQAIGADSASRTIAVEQVVLKLIEQVELPARDAGVLTDLLVTEGEHVTVGQSVARLDDRASRVAVERAELELHAARNLAEKTTSVELAHKQVAREKRRLEEARSLAKITKRTASNRIAQQIAERTAEKARADLRRVKQSREKLASSVSDKEFDQTQLNADKAQLDLDQAQFDLETAAVRAMAQDESVEAQQHAVEAAELEVEAASQDRNQATIQKNLKEVDLRLRRLQLEFQDLVSPIDGVVVERYRHPGEWVEHGQRVLRIIHLKRLRAEGYIPQEIADTRLIGRPARLSVRLKDGRTLTRTGTVNLIGSEVDPIKLDVRVWAEIDNADGLLRPGTQGLLEIDGLPDE